MAQCPKCKKMGCWVDTDLKPICGCRNEIPPMTHPLSSAWDQPKTSEILIDDTHALMNEDTFRRLKDYSFSTPSGVYEGKMWKSKHGDIWYLKWFGYSENPDLCSNNHREIIIV